MLVDTDILVDYIKDLTDAVEFVEAHIDQIFVSAITIAELYQGRERWRGAKCAG